MHVSSLFLYPVKSVRGHPLDAAAVEQRGLAGDRRWMLVDDAGRFLTRRQFPDMALLDVGTADDGLRFRHPRLGSCVATIPPPTAPTITGTVWRDTLPVMLGNDEADAFLSAAIGRTVRLAYQFDASCRPTDSKFSQAGDHVSLADGYPVLVTSEGSLDALNDRLAAPVTMERFRPNLVISGAAPWAEDRWRRVRIGEVMFRIARACARCIVITQQPETGERLDGNEPLTTLRTMGRAGAGGVMFGQNVIPDRLGTIHVGDRVEVLAEGDSNL